MLRLYVDPALVACRAGDTLALPAPAARHVQVRRLQPGDPLVLFDGRGGEWHARVRSMARTAVEVAVDRHDAVERELALAVTLAVGMPANDRMDFLVEKATELGVAALRPLHCERSVLRLAGERAERKRAHWQALAVAACEQCGRTRVPDVAAVADLGAVVEPAPAAGWLLIPHAPAGLPAVPPGGALTVLSGPEGGFTPAEEARAIAAGWLPVGLGPRVLRADTAPLAVLARLAIA